MKLYYSYPYFQYYYLININLKLTIYFIIIMTTIFINPFLPKRRCPSSRIPERPYHL